jgi:murein DD-endopeptidase MepM/ murein hydrolase activator NlpD
MTCRRVRRLLSIRRELSEQERALVENHLIGCPACHAIAREYELIDRRLCRLPQPEPAAALVVAVQARRIAKEQTMVAPASSWRWQALEGMALIAVVALILFAAWAWQGQHPAFILDPDTALTIPQRVTQLDIGQPLAAQLGDQVRLLGYDFEPGAPPRLILYWQARAEIETSYTVFVHLLDEDSHLWAQQDSLPGKGAVPTTAWKPGEVVVDEYELAISADAPSGNYVIEIGMVQSETGQRLPVTGEDGQVLGYALPLEGLFYWFSVTDNPTSRFVWPTFGYLGQAYWSGHRAIDIASQPGTPVTAAADGKVVLVDHDDEYGIHVLLDHGNGYETLYAHLRGAGVEAGDEVRKQQQIGEVGSSGKSTGPHLHFEIRKDGVRLDPFKVVTGEAGSGGLRLASGTGVAVNRTDANTGDYVWPVSGRVTRGYSSEHKALDIAGLAGTPVHAIADGTVALSDRDDNLHGIHLLINHDDGSESFYSHLNAALVEAGQKVKKGSRSERSAAPVCLPVLTFTWRFVGTASA